MGRGGSGALFLGPIDVGWGTRWGRPVASVGGSCSLLQVVWGREQARAGAARQGRVHVHEGGAMVAFSPIVLTGGMGAFWFVWLMEVVLGFF